MELSPKKEDLLQDLRALIEAARGQVARVVNTGQVALYWSVGERLRRDVLGGKRAAYGRQIVATVSHQLVLEYGRGFTPTELRRMVQFVELFPDSKICATLLRKLTWSHFLLLIPIKNQVEREFYAELCRIEAAASDPRCPAETGRPNQFRFGRRLTATGLIQLV